jgi:methyltransferase (TIGR00027 family)
MPLSSSSSSTYDESTSLLTDVQATALFVAYIRHLESQKHPQDDERRLLVDPYAEILLNQMDPEQRYIQKWKQSPEMIQATLDVVAIRTRVIDDWLLLPTTTTTTSQTTTTVRQIVNLGAGLCCRPYRLQQQHDKELWKYFEIETDRSILDWKRNILAEHHALNNNTVIVINVQADLQDLPGLASALVQAGFDTRLPTDWIAEGLFSYVPAEQHEPILAALYSLSSSSSSSRIILSNVQPEFAQHAKKCGVDFPHS